jgi:hypothetical protein
MLPVLTRQSHDLTAGLARSARPAAPVRREPLAAPRSGRAGIGLRRAAASVLRWSADRLAPVAE